MPKYPDYGKIMTGGCRGFARNTMVWPEDLIVGGVKRQNHKLISAEAFQSIFLVASGGDVFSRYKVQLIYSFIPSRYHFISDINDIFVRKKLRLLD